MRELLEIKSTVISGQKRFSLEDDIREFLAENFDQEEGIAVFYTYPEVFFASYKDGRFITFGQKDFTNKYIEKVRLFNEKQELYLWRISEGNFGYRLRIDGTGGNEEKVIEARQYLWGRKVENIDNIWTSLSEERGINILIPRAYAKNAKIYFLTRNYIKYNEKWHPTFYDSRLVEIMA